MFDKVKKFYEDHKAEIFVATTIGTIYTVTVIVSAKIAGIEAAKATAQAIAKLPEPDEAVIIAGVAKELGEQLVPIVKDGMAEFATEALGAVRQQVQQVPSYTSPLFR